MDSGLSLSMANTDVALIGAGPIGVEMAVALKQAGIDYLHLEKRQVGQTIFWFTPQTRFFSSTERLAIAGVPLQTVDQTKCTREEYLTYLRTVVQQFDLDIRLYHRVLGVSRRDGVFRIETEHAGLRDTVQANRVILATGGTAKPRALGLPGEELPHVSHYFHEPHTYFRQKVLVVGGKNSAVEAALRCHHAGAFVSVSYRRGGFDPKVIKYWLLPEINSLIDGGQIQGHFNTVPRQFGPTGATLSRVDTGQTFDVPADFVLLMVGYLADMCLCQMAGVTLISPSSKPLYDNRTMETDVPGLYVAGTAVEGTQEHFGAFIENCHIHVGRIIAALTGRAPPEEPKLPEKLEM